MRFKKCVGGTTHFLANSDINKSAILGPGRFRPGHQETPKPPSGGFLFIDNIVLSEIR
ncbi:hypothetical protein C2759_08480 [Polynucleobacter sp. MG-Unter2-18]|nr:hypothetical protein C2759_08480 [Polynucleobacter sp. MG-Unter2-18]